MIIKLGNDNCYSDKPISHIYCHILMQYMHYNDLNNLKHVNETTYFTLES